MASPVQLTHLQRKPEVPQTLKEIVCLRDDGRLLVSKTHSFHPDVQAFQARLKRLGHSVDVNLVDMSVIKTENEGGDAQGRVASSDIQTYAQELFRKAVDMGASDIHFRVSKRAAMQVIFRIDGDLEYQEEHPMAFGQAVCSAIYQAMADVADSNYMVMSFQDARISDKSKLPKGVDGIRIGTGPQVDGNVMALRLLYNSADQSLDPRSLGFEDHHARLLDAMKRMPTGLNIIAGPTGAGKSTTLHRVLSAIHVEAKGRKNILTVEDPPEYPMVGIVQMPVNNVQTEDERSGAFQMAISGAMRLDPDVLMIGEIRDTASAKLAFRAAMTGHQVWTSLHANSAFAILTRLVDLGVPMEMVCDPEIVTGLTCQKLLKKLCLECRIPLAKVHDRYPADDVDRILRVAPLDQIYVTGEGCECCRHTGNLGRSVVAETVVTNDTLMHLMRSGEIGQAKEHWLNEMKGETMVDHAIRKVRSGSVDPFHAEEKVGPLVARSLHLDN